MLTTFQGIFKSIARAFKTQLPVAISPIVVQGPFPHSLPPMAAFDVVVVGAGGGPDETNLSAYLVKTHSARWKDGVLALEAGSGQGALKRILSQNPRLFDSEDEEDSPSHCPTTASDIYNAINCFLITHAHLDHIASLVISAGSLSGPRKRVYAVKQTLQDLSIVFSDRIWPNLASWDAGDEEYKLLYFPLSNNGNYQEISSDISVQTFPLNHGLNDLGHYESAAYFIRNNLNNREFLFFGDVEPDSITAIPRTINVWQAAAPKIPDILSTIFIECSWPSGRPNNQLYGHLTPEHLVDELVTLAKEVRKWRPANHSSEVRTRPLRKRVRKNPSMPDIRDALDGVRVFVTHCKDGKTDSSGRSTRDIIVGEIRTLVEAKALGVTILAAEQGMRKFNVHDSL